jgi:hypothetical protein
MANAGEFPALPDCAVLSSIRTTDKRLTTRIGKRYVETNPSITAPIDTGSEVAAWVRTGATSATQRAGIKEKKNGPVLRITVRQINLNENVARRSGYDGRIVLSVQLTRRGGGVCWEEQIEGASENYGYSGSAENYQETLNHALDRAMVRLLSEPGFQKNICSCGG